MRHRVIRRVVLCAGLMSGTLVAVPMAAALAGAGGATLGPGERLLPGQAPVDGPAQVLMQTDGNLVDRVGAQVMWATHTEGHPGSVLTLQTDGNLVVRSADGVARWDSATAGRPAAIASLAADGYFAVYPDAGGPLWTDVVGITPGPSVLRPGESATSGSVPSMVSTDNRIQLAVGPNSATAYETVYAYTAATWVRAGPVVGGTEPGRLTMQTDGNLVLRGTDGAAYWSTGTSVPGSAFTVQTDGNLVVRAPDGHAAWSAGTTRVLLGAGELVKPGTRFVSRYPGHGSSDVTVFQTDGNLVARSADGRAFWSSGTAGNPASSLAMQSDGNLVIYGPLARSLWSTGTAGCGAKGVFSATHLAIVTSRGFVWSPGTGRQHC